MTFSRRYTSCGLARRPGSRWLSATGEAVSYLLEYSANPLVFPPSTGSTVTTETVPGADDEFRTQGFSVDVQLSTLGSARYVFQYNANGRLWFGAANTVKYRGDVGTTHTLTPASAIQANDVLRIAVDMTGGTLYYKNVTQDTATESMAITGDWDLVETTLNVGWDGSGNAWAGSIWQPTEFSVPS